MYFKRRSEVEGVASATQLEWSTPVAEPSLGKLILLTGSPEASGAVIWLAVNSPQTCSTPSREMVDPSRTKLLMARDEPISEKSTSAMEDPSRETARTDTDDPLRAKLLKDTEEARVAQPTTERVDPKMPTPKSDNDDPIRANVRNAIEAPTHAGSKPSTDIEAPSRARP